jgi:hypothetical protein
MTDHKSCTIFNGNSGILDKGRNREKPDMRGSFILGTGGLGFSPWRNTNSQPRGPENASEGRYRSVRMCCMRGQKDRTKAIFYRRSNFCGVQPENAGERVVQWFQNLRSYWYNLIGGDLLHIFELSVLPNTFLYFPIDKSKGSLSVS